MAEYEINFIQYDLKPFELGWNCRYRTVDPADPNVKPVLLVVDPDSPERGWVIDNDSVRIMWIDPQFGTGYLCRPLCLRTNCNRIYMDSECENKYCPTAEEIKQARAAIKAIRNLVRE